MKTADEIYNQEDYIAGCQTDGVVNEKEIALKAMKAYAKQAIDRCAEVAAKMSDNDYYDGQELTDKVKSELK